MINCERVGRSRSLIILKHHAVRREASCLRACHRRMDRRQALDRFHHIRWRIRTVRPPKDRSLVVAQIGWLQAARPSHAFMSSQESSHDFVAAIVRISGLRKVQCEGGKALLRNNRPSPEPASRRLGSPPVAFLAVYFGSVAIESHLAKCFRGVFADLIKNLPPGRPHRYSQYERSSRSRG